VRLIRSEFKVITVCFIILLLKGMLQHKYNDTFNFNATGAVNYFRLDNIIDRYRYIIQNIRIFR